MRAGTMRGEDSEENEKTAEQRANEMLKHQCFITPFNAVKPIKHLMFTAALGK